MSIIQLQGISKFYANHTALNKVSFNVPKGSIFGLLGPNGAGKTSLIRIINQITAPDEGSILLDGEKLNKEHIKRIGYLPEERGLYKKMSVYDQLLYFAKLRGMKVSDAKKTIHMWLEKFEATTWKNKKIEELSKGMQQKIQFIVTVMHNPDFIILDEPFTGFDPKNTQLIKDEIQNLKNNGASIMLSTHRMENVEAICDNVVLLNKAKVVAQGSVMDVRRSLKTDLFELACTNSVNPEDISGINIVSTENKDGLTRMVFSYQSTENLAALAAQDIQIKEYREVIPSMQEVFLTLTDSDHE
ncbi:MAG: ATP-binding cassette domain-containing protein [Bacteroidia bacterium]|jgi:ABC-2 type transport system ATP-binding protein|tara:strand:+ start:13624 stop:14526 length:903 start_codon:yes stop_codon:yes gene_type:complete